MQIGGAQEGFGHDSEAAKVTRGELNQFCHPWVNPAD
jgi:hypothetical protein